MRRRWKSRSNVGSTVQRGGPMRNGGDSTRWRKRGIRQRRAVDAARAAGPSRAARSKIATATIVDRRIGSFSMFHMSASSSLMWCANRAVAIGHARRRRTALDGSSARIGRPGGATASAVSTCSSRYVTTNGIRLFCLEAGPPDGPLRAAAARLPRARVLVAAPGRGARRGRVPRGRARPARLRPLRQARRHLRLRVDQRVPDRAGRRARRASAS